MIKHLTPRSEEEINAYLATISYKDLIFSMDFFHMDLDFAKTELCKRLHIIDIKLMSTGFSKNVIYNLHHHLVHYYTLSMQVDLHNRKQLFRTLKKENVRYEIEDEETNDNFTKTILKIRIKFYKN